MTEQRVNVQGQIQRRHGSECSLPQAWDGPYCYLFLVIQGEHPSIRASVLQIRWSTSGQRTDAAPLHFPFFTSLNISRKIAGLELEMHSRRYSVHLPRMELWVEPPTFHKNQCSCTHLNPSWRWWQKDQGNPWLQSKLRLSTGYTRTFLRKRKPQGRDRMMETPAHY